MTDHETAVTGHLDQGANVMVMPNGIAACYPLYWLKLPQKYP